MHTVNQPAKVVQKLKKKNGHTMYTCLQPRFTIRKQFSRSSRGSIYGREHDDPMDDLDVNMVIGGFFLNATLRAAAHLGQDQEANPRYVKNILWNNVGHSFRETAKLISDQMEGHAKKCVEHDCDLANKTNQQLKKLQLHALVAISSKQYWAVLRKCQN